MLFSSIRCSLFMGRMWYLGSWKGICKKIANLPLVEVLYLVMYYILPVGRRMDCWCGWLGRYSWRICTVKFHFYTRWNVAYLNQLLAWNRCILLWSWFWGGLLTFSLAALSVFGFFSYCFKGRFNLSQDVVTQQKI